MANADAYIILPNGNEYDVMSGDLFFPYIGNFSAHLLLSNADVAPTGKVRLVWLKSEFVCYVLKSGINDGRVSCLLVGGNGGLWQSVVPKMYDYTIRVSLPLTETLSSAGESLSSLSTQSVISQQLTSWPRTQGRCDEQISLLADQAGAIWRVRQDGTIFFGTDSWLPVNEFEYDLQWRDPTWSSATIISQSIGILPGQSFPKKDESFPGKKVAAAQYEITEEMTHATFWFADDNGVEIDDQLHAGLAVFVKQTMRYVDFYAEYPARVVLQRNDGTLDVIPDSRRLPPITSVPVRVPVPGTKIKVNPEDRVTVLFEGGDPTKYSAQLYPSGNGGRLLARKGGKVNVGELMFTAVANGVLTGTYTDGDGNVQGFSLNTPIPLSGKIIDGWTRWEVGNES